MKIFVKKFLPVSAVPRCLSTEWSQTLRSTKLSLLRSSTPLPTPPHLSFPQILENSEKWGVDMFRISELTDKKTLTCVTYTIFQERDLIKTFKIPAKVFLNFLRTLEDHYLQVNTLNTMLNASDCLFHHPSFEISYQDLVNTTI